MLILLPPSERKNSFNSELPLTSSFGESQIIKSKSIFSELVVSQKNYVDFNNSLSASDRFTGVLWKEIDGNSKTNNYSKVFVYNPVLIISNFYDIIPLYKISTKPIFSNININKEYLLFKEETTKKFVNSQEIILDFTTNDIRNVLYGNSKYKNVYQFNYLTKNKKFIGHYAKKCKGIHINNILKNIELKDYSQDLMKLIIKEQRDPSVYLTIT